MLAGLYRGNCPDNAIRDGSLISRFEDEYSRAETQNARVSFEMASACHNSFDDSIWGLAFDGFGHDLDPAKCNAGIQFSAAGDGKCHNPMARFK